MVPYAAATAQLAEAHHGSTAAIPKCALLFGGCTARPPLRRLHSSPTLWRLLSSPRHRQRQLADFRDFSWSPSSFPRLFVVTFFISRSTRGHRRIHQLLIYPREHLLRVTAATSSCSSSSCSSPRIVAHFRGAHCHLSIRSLY